MHTKGVVAVAVLALTTSGCTHWGSTTSYGPPRALGRRPIGAPQMATTSTSSVSAGFAGASASNRAGTRTSMIAGLSGNSDSMTRTHCVQMFEIDYEQTYETVGKVEGRALDTVGGVALGLLGLGVIGTSRANLDFDTGERRTNQGEMLVGVGMVVGGIGWIWYANQRLPKGPPPSSPQQIRTWTSNEFAETTGCGLVPGGPVGAYPVAPAPAPPAAPNPAPGASSDIEARLQKLEDLRAHGLITQEEYEVKRKALLDNL